MKVNKTVPEEVPAGWKSRKGFPEPPAEGSVEVQFEFNSKGIHQIDWATLRFVLGVNEAPIVLSLPRQFADLNRQFSGLSPDLKDAVLSAIQFRDTVKLEDVALLLKAVQQDFPIPFRGSREFRDALRRLIERPLPPLLPGERPGFPKITRSKLLHEFQLMQASCVPLVIMIHGSSVAGLRGKDKGKGWQFGRDSDIDVTIVDVTRFVWAQALGILTYDTVDTTELTDEHLHLLKLHRFADAFRKTVRDYKVNFIVYSDEESARKHSGFTLICTFNEQLGDFEIQRIFNREFLAQSVPQSKLKGVPHRLQQFFGVEEIPDIEKRVLASDLEHLRGQGQLKPPEQGNHIFNDVPDVLVALGHSIHSKFELSPSIEFVDEYIHILRDSAFHLRRLSRVVQIAQGEHGSLANAIIKGFDMLSDAVNELLFGNAVTYFRNASMLFCNLIAQVPRSPLRLAETAPIVKKSFANLLDSAVDEALLHNFIQFKPASKLALYAIEEAKAFKATLRRKVNRFFKQSLDELILRIAITLVETRLSELRRSGQEPTGDVFFELFEGLTAEQAWIVTKRLSL